MVHSQIHVLFTMERLVISIGLKSALGGCLRSLSTSVALNRNAFLGSQDPELLWKSMTSVSPQGKQRGRMRGLMRRKNLNMGKKLGHGPAGIQWSGLNATPDVFKSRDLADEDTKRQYEEEVEALQALKAKRFQRRERLTPLERGWAGGSPQGRIFTAPTTNELSVDFDGFKSILIESKMVSHMTTTGRDRRMSYLMITGNGQGLAGFALTSMSTLKAFKLAQLAVNRAGNRLMKVELYENRTVFHSFFSRFGSTMIHVSQRPEGTGIRAHRVIKAACDVIGIKDLEVHIDGRQRNYLHIMKAFFLGLLRQRTHQQLADEMGLHLVEMRPEEDNYPRLLASPKGSVRTKDEIGVNEILDFEAIAYEGHMPWVQYRKHLSISDDPNYIWPHQNHHRDLRRPADQLKQQKLDMLIDCGRVGSWLEPLYPECKPVVSYRRFKGLKRQEEERSDEA